MNDRIQPSSFGVEVDLLEVNVRDLIHVTCSLFNFLLNLIRKFANQIVERARSEPVLDAVCNERIPRAHNDAGFFLACALNPSLD